MQPSATLTNGATDEAHIRQLIERWAEAVRTKDSHALVAGFARDVVVFDLLNPLRYAGIDAVRKRAEEWLSNFEGEIGYGVHDLSISTGDRVAFCHSINRVNGMTRDGTKVDMAWRATVCLRKQEGKWLVTHEHSSVPFDMKSGKASLDLKP